MYLCGGFQTDFIKVPYNMKARWPRGPECPWHESIKRGGYIKIVQRVRTIIVHDIVHVMELPFCNPEMSFREGVFQDCRARTAVDPFNSGAMVWNVRNPAFDRMIHQMIVSVIWLLEPFIPWVCQRWRRDGRRTVSTGRDAWRLSAKIYAMSQLTTRWSIDRWIAERV